MNSTWSARRRVCLFNFGGGMALSMLVACGGGGGGSAEAPAVSVTSVTLSSATPKYSQELLVTVDGSHLDQGLVISSTGCKNPTLGTTAPHASTASVAYYTCTASAVGASRVDVAAAGGGAVLQGADFTVAVPQVMLSIQQGGALVGDVVITLDPTHVPVTVNNFLAYVNAGFYSGTVLHWVASDLVQGGGYLPLAGNATPTPKATTLPYIPREVSGGLHNVTWSVAMARLGPADSASSQFFINLRDNSSTFDPSPVNAGNVVFGTVTAGEPIVSSVAASACTPIAAYSACWPNVEVLITSATQTQ